MKFWILIKWYTFARWSMRILRRKQAADDYNIRLGATLLAQLSQSLKRHLAKRQYQEPRPPQPVQTWLDRYPVSGDLAIPRGTDTEIWSADMTTYKGTYRDGTYIPGED